MRIDLADDMCKYTILTLNNIVQHTIENIYNIFVSGKLKLKWLISMILNLNLAPKITYWNSL
jgi:hypothetical protein